MSSLKKLSSRTANSTTTTTPSPPQEEEEEEEEQQQRPKDDAMSTDEIRESQDDVKKQQSEENANNNNNNNNDLGVEGTKRLFKPPKEVMIDPYAVPPSPIRDPTISHPQAHHLPDMLPTSNTSNNSNGDEDDELLRLNFDTTTTTKNNNQQRPQPKKNLFPHQQYDDNYCLGDPLGDIAMKRQLLDAQRLVRLILGKPLGGDQPLLETTTILQAIRSFAMMKQEIIELRKRQEDQDGDPPAILRSLGSPSTSTTTTTTTPASTARRTPASATTATKFSFENQPSLQEEGEEETTNESDSDSDSSSPIIPSNTTTFEQGKIHWLEQQLKTANDTILKLQEEKQSYVQNSGQRKAEESPLEAAASKQVDTDECNYDLEQKYKELQLRYVELVQRHEAAVEESKKNLLDVVEEVASVPKRVLVKGTVRDKLKAYCQTITYHASQVQIIELETKMQREREESNRRIQELEHQLRRVQQQDAHPRKIDEMLHSTTTTTTTTTSSLQNVEFPSLSSKTSATKDLIDPSSNIITSTNPSSVLKVDLQDEKKTDDCLNGKNVTVSSLTQC